MDFSLAWQGGLLSSCGVRAARCGGLLLADHRLPDSSQAQHYGHRPGCSGTRWFSDWASALSLLHWQADSFPLSHPGSPVWFLKWRKRPLSVHEVEDKDGTKWEGPMGNKSALITRVCACVRARVFPLSEEGVKRPEKQGGLRMRPLAHFQPVVQRKQLEYNFYLGARQGSGVSLREPELVIDSHGLKLSHVSESPGGLVERQISEPYPGLPFF